MAVTVFPATMPPRFRPGLHRFVRIWLKATRRQITRVEALDPEHGLVFLSTGPQPAPSRPDYGWVDPLLGVVVAFISAVAAIRWLLRVISGKSLARFGWYRLAVGLLTLGLISTGRV